MSEIDVSKCKYNYTSITKHSCCYAESERHVCMRKCKDFPNCYYKQLQKIKAALDEIAERIKYIQAAAERIDEDNCITFSYIISQSSKNILQLIKQIKEVKE